MTLRILILFIFFISFTNVLSQSKIDSLKQLLKKPTEEMNEGRILTRIANIYLKANQNDTALHYYHQALNVNEKENRLKYIAANSNDIGVLYFKKASFDSSIFYYQKALKNYIELKDTLRMAMSELNIGMAYKNLGNYERSVGYLLASAEKLEQTSNINILTACYNTLGNVFSKIGEHSKALYFHKSALEGNIILNNKRKIAASLNNLGNIYYTLDNHDSSLYYFNESLKLHRQEGFEGAGIILGNIGGIISDDNRFEEAHQYLQEALELARAEDDRFNELKAHNNLASNFLKQKKYDEAKRHIESGAGLAVELKALGEREENLKLQVLYYSAIGDNESLISVFEEYDLIKDSLFNHNKAESLADMEVKYETDKKVKEIAILQQEHALQEAEIQLRQNWINSLLVVSCLIIIIGALLYRNSRITTKSKQRVELLLKELQHRVKNNLQIISSLLSLQSQQLTDTHAIEAIKSGENRVNAMAMIHRRLYSSEKVSELNIKDYISEIIQYLVQTYGFSNQNLELNLRIDDKYVDVDKAIPLGLIVNELVSNALKYGLKAADEPILNIQLSVTDSEITLVISDNGPGLPSDFNIENLTSLGLKIVKLLVNDLQGVLAINAEEGATYSLKIPLRYGKN